MTELPPFFLITISGIALVIMYLFFYLVPVGLWYTAMISGVKIKLSFKNATSADLRQVDLISQGKRRN